MTSEEEAATSYVLKPLYGVSIPVNDYFSWEKEFNSGKVEPSSVGLYMRWFSMSSDDARAAIKTKIIELEEEYVELKSNFLQQNSTSGLSTNINRWFDIMEDTTAGNMLWSMYCPRYNDLGAIAIKNILIGEENKDFSFLPVLPSQINL